MCLCGKPVVPFLSGLHGVQSRAQSESSGEFSMSLENEPWSNGSSPVQQPPSRCSSSSYQTPSGTSTPRHTLRHQNSWSAVNKEKASTIPHTKSLNVDLKVIPKQKDPGLTQDFWLTRGTKSIRRGSRAKVTVSQSSDSGDMDGMNPGHSGMAHLKSSSCKAETSRVPASPSVTVLYVQGKSSSMSGCLNCFTTPLEKEGRLKGVWSPKGLRRASSVISTAEGSSRHSSISSDCRAEVKAETLPALVSDEADKREQSASSDQQAAGENSEPVPIPPVKPPRDPVAVVTKDHHKAPVQESLLCSPFTFNSVFSNTIFSDSAVNTTTSLDALENNQTFVCLEQNGPVVIQEASPNKWTKHGK